MKSRIINLLVLLLGFAAPSHASVVQVDPALTGAVAAQMEVLRELFAKREKTQKKIIDAEAAVTIAMSRMHHVEEQWLGYLSNASDAVQNLYQIKRAGELVAIYIPQNISNVKKAMPGNLKGTAISLLVSKELANAVTQMTTLMPLMKELVTKGSYSYDSFDENGKPVTKQKKVNLLDSAERYFVANSIVSKLEAINSDLFILSWQIRYMGWDDLWQAIDPEGWANVVTGKYIVNGIINDWKNLARY